MSTETWMVIVGAEAAAIVALARAFWVALGWYREEARKRMKQYHEYIKELRDV